MRRSPERTSLLPSPLPRRWRHWPPACRRGAAPATASHFGGSVPRVAQKTKQKDASKKAKPVSGSANFSLDLWPSRSTRRPRTRGRVLPAIQGCLRRERSRPARITHRRPAWCSCDAGRTAAINPRRRHGRSRVQRAWRRSWRARRQALRRGSAPWSWGSSGGSSWSGGTARYVRILSIVRLTTGPAVIAP